MFGAGRQPTQRCRTSSRGCVAGDRHRHHGLVDRLAQLHAGGGTGRDYDPVVIDDRDIEGHAGVLGRERRDDRAREESLRDGRDRDAQHAARRPFRRDRLQRGLHIRERLGQRVAQAFAGLRQAHGARGAHHQRRAECILQSPDALAHRGARHAEAIGGRAEVALGRHGKEQRQQIEIDVHCPALLIIASRFSGIPERIALAHFCRTHTRGV